MQKDIVKVIDQNLIVCRPTAAMQHPATHGGPFYCKIYPFCLWRLLQNLSNYVLDKTEWFHHNSTVRFWLQWDNRTFNFAYCIITDAMDKLSRKFKAYEAVLKGNTFIVQTNLHQLHGRLSQICESDLSLRYVAHQ